MNWDPLSSVDYHPTPKKQRFLQHQSAHVCWKMEITALFASSYEILRIPNTLRLYSIST